MGLNVQTMTGPTGTFSDYMPANSAKEELTRESSSRDAIYREQKSAGGFSKKYASGIKMPSDSKSAAAGQEAYIPNDIRKKWGAGFKSSQTGPTTPDNYGGPMQKKYGGNVQGSNGSSGNTNTFQ